MTDFNSDKQHFLEPWFKIGDNGKYFEDELLREVGQTHALYGKKVTSIAFRRDQDDVLFRVDGSENEYAVVHLTYNKESDPRWPAATFYKDWTTVYQECILIDHNQWLQDN